MACATLKRSLELDPVHSPSSRPNKRRRCMPMCMTPTTPPTRQAETAASVFSDATKHTPEQIVSNIREEMQRLHRRRQLHFEHEGNSSGSEAHMESATAGPLSPSAFMEASTTSPLFKDKPLFTFRQVRLICERMLQNQEDNLRGEYDRVLNCKLAEQYDAFVKFSYDQIQKQFRGDAPSYLS